MIEVQHLSKSFGPITAVDDVTFTVEKGEVLGFLGPNGAGKSTSMRMITGFIPPTAGTAVIGGCDIQQQPIAARKKIGYLPENAPVYPDMTVDAYLRFCAEIRGFSGSTLKGRVADTIEKCFLSSVRHQSISTLSKGYKQRVCFAQSILHDPEYLILDEPTDGLDPNQKHEVRQMIRDMSANKSIILSTHILDEVDAVCTRAIIIAGGRIVVDDTPERLRARSTLHGAISLRTAATEAEALVARLGAIEAVRDVRIVDQTPRELNIRIFPKSAEEPILDQVMSQLSENGCRVHAISIEQGRLDEVFRTITAAA